jgi:hypothetical protein
MDGVASVEPFGDALHLFLDTDAASVDHLKAKLEEAELGPAEFREVEPSLEDVFILQINKKQEEAES